MVAGRRRKGERGVAWCSEREECGQPGREVGMQEREREGEAGRRAGWARGVALWLRVAGGVALYLAFTCNTYAMSRLLQVI